MLIGSLFEKLADGKEKAISGYTFSSGLVQLITRQS